MQIFSDINSIKKFLRSQQLRGLTIGFIPTMGCLHDGHRSLILKSVEENDITVVSIFVNPTQFGTGEDFELYPRNIEKDIETVEKCGSQVVFCPSIKEMYPNDYNTYVEVNELTTSLCGAARPDHFKGVTTVVTKLLNIIHPNKAYFGQKDAQQAIVIQQMVKDLSMDVDIIISHIVREKDGLAMSSRNVYLDYNERSQATILYEALGYAEKLYENGERNTTKLKMFIENIIKTSPLAVIEYVSIVDAYSLKPVETISSKCLVALAVKFGSTRLIDNITLA